MKIALVNNYYRPVFRGGAERSVQALAEALVDEGHRVSVITLGRQDGAERIDGVQVVRLRLANVYWPLDDFAAKPFFKPLWHLIDLGNLLMARRAARRIFRLDADIVHTHNISGFSTHLWAMAQRGGIPVVHTLRDYSLLCPHSTMYKKGRNCPRACASCTVYHLIKKRHSRHVGAVVGISRFLLSRHLAHGFFKDTAFRRVIRNIFPPPATNPGADAPDGGRGLRIGFLGQIVPHKGIELFLRAAENLSDMPCRFVIGGDLQSAYARGLAARYGSRRIRFAGIVDPDAFFRSVDLLVVPSLWHEPLGRVVIEAHAHGVPVVGTDRGGIPEILEDGRTGFVSSRADEEALRRLLVRLVRRPELLQKQSEACRQAATSYRPAVIAGQHVALYRRLLRCPARFRS